MSTTTFTQTPSIFTGLIFTSPITGAVTVEITSGSKSYRARVYKNLGGRTLRWIGDMPPSAGVQVAREIARIR